MAVANFPCPCCGHRVFDEPPGSYAICPVCFWEDDAVQLRWPDYGGGANSPSLIEAQQTYRLVGAMEPRFISKVRVPGPNEPLDADWRPIDLVIDDFEPRAITEEPWPDDDAALYWWRPTFWRAR
ncbi:CPCC family cysteine-rich protein [Isoptericola sp. NPDC060257]|uniref:CPCC family cysteine-rich protein n=1 Tax=Isoptericola sp. NPDC060257 TaxID=3347087 RepID=UPI0036673AED